MIVKDIFKRAVYVAPIGVLFSLFNRTAEVIDKYKEFGTNGTYQCTFSSYQPCPLSEFILKSDSAWSSYFSMILNFVLVFIVVSFLLSLVYAYKNNRKGLLWFLLVVVVLIIIVLMLFKFNILG